MTAEEVIRLLDLEPLLPEGGYYRRIWYSSDRAPQPPGGEAPTYRTGSAIYYLLTKDTVSSLHSLKSQELWHFYQGDPVELTLFPENGATPATVPLGQELSAGQRPFHAVPAGTVFGATLIRGGSWALMGNSLYPSFEPEDFRTIDPEPLIKKWPQWKDRILQLSR